MNGLARKISQEMAQVQFEIIEDPKSFAALKSTWDSLAARSVFPTPFQFYGFGHSWWRAYSDSISLKIILGSALNEVRCLAPFCEEKPHPGVWTPLGERGADYLDLLVAKDDHTAQEGFRRWILQSRHWSKIEWHDLTEVSSLLEIPSIHALKKRGIWPRVQRAFQQHFPLALNLGPSHHCFMTESDLATKRDVLSHRSHTKHSNWLGRLGALKYTRLVEPADILKSLDTLVTMHQRKWSSKGIPSFYDDPRAIRFTQYLIEALAEHRCMRLDLLSISNKPIAAHLGFQSQGRLYWYITAYDPDFNAHSPGKLLLGHVIRNADRDGVTEIDFLRGAESYKEQYGTGRRTVTGIQQYRTRTAYLSDAVKRHFFKK